MKSNLRTDPLHFLSSLYQLQMTSPKFLSLWYNSGFVIVGMLAIDHRFEFPSGQTIDYKICYLLLLR